MASIKLTQTKISDTYAGVLHANGSALPATGLADIYDGVGNKTSIQIGRACNGVTICGPLSCNTLTTTSKLSASTQFDILNLLNVLHPVNSIIITFDSNNPGTRTGWNGTTWAQVSQGRFIAGVGSGNDGVTSYTVPVSNFNGEYNHKLTEAEMPTHTHIMQTLYVSTNDDNAGATGYFGSSYRNLSYSGVTPNLSLAALTTGDSQSHNNIPPGFGLYIWRRTA